LLLLLCNGCRRGGRVGSFGRLLLLAAGMLVGLMPTSAATAFLLANFSFGLNNLVFPSDDDLGKLLGIVRSSSFFVTFSLDPMLAAKEVSIVGGYLGS
jgi:hypothetical protein